MFGAGTWDFVPKPQKVQYLQGFALNQSPLCFLGQLFYLYSWRKRSFSSASVFYGKVSSGCQSFHVHSEKPYCSSFYQIYSDPLLNQEGTTEAEIPLILGAGEKEEGKEEGGEPIIKQMETENAAGLILFYCEEMGKGHRKELFFPLRKNHFFCLIFECSFDILDLDFNEKLNAKKVHTQKWHLNTLLTSDFLYLSP